MQRLGTLESRAPQLKDIRQICTVIQQRDSANVCIYSDVDDVDINRLNELAHRYSTIGLEAYAFEKSYPEET